MNALGTAVGLAALFWAPHRVHGVNNETQYVRRTQLPEVECIPLLKVTEAGNGLSDKEWSCQLLARTPAAEGKRGRIRTIKGIENIPLDIFRQFESARTYIKIPGAVVTAINVLVPPGAAVRLEKIPDSVVESRRRLQSTVGDKKVIAIRVTTGERNGPHTTGPHTTASAVVMSQEIFGTGGGDSMNLVSQYAACSFDKLTFSPLDELAGPRDPKLPAAGKRGAGVYEVTVDWSPSSGILQDAITDQLNADWPDTTLPESAGGPLDPSAPFDHAMYCMPPETDMGIAYAFENHWLSVYRDEWCLYPSSQMHEIAHNMGLDHSWEASATGNIEYDDQSGIMGNSYRIDDGPEFCFNSVKSWKLGWYSDKTEVFNPFTTPTWTGNLNGIANYDIASNPVILKMESGTITDYYINFNRQIGINSETQEGGNQVLVTSKGENGVNYSVLMAKLSEGDSVVIEDFRLSALVSANAIETTASPAYASVDITTQVLPGFINCGAEAFDDGTNLWHKDTKFVDEETTSAYSTGGGIQNTGTFPQEIYQTERYLNTGENMIYSLPLSAGSYDVFLHFAEIYETSEDARIFDVILEGDSVHEFLNVDVFKDAGGAFKAHIKSVTNFPVNGGTLTVQLVKRVQNPKINAIAVYPVSSAPEPSSEPSSEPSLMPSKEPSMEPSLSSAPSETVSISSMPSDVPSNEPSLMPSDVPSNEPSLMPSAVPSMDPSSSPEPSNEPSRVPSFEPSLSLMPTGGSSPTLSAVWIQCAGRECSFSVRNTDSTKMFTITRMDIDWEGPRLRKIQQGDTAIWRGRNSPPATTITSWQGSIALRQIPEGEKEYRLVFDSNPALDTDVASYTIHLTLEESGEAGPPIIEIDVVQEP